MRFSPRVDRLAGHGADAWSVHIEARRRQQAGEDIIFLTVGDPDQAPPEAVIEATVVALRQHRTGYAPTIGYPALREAIAARVARRSASPARPIMSRSCPGPKAGFTPPCNASPGRATR